MNVRRTLYANIVSANLIITFRERYGNVPCLVGQAGISNVLFASHSILCDATTYLSYLLLATKSAYIYIYTYIYIYGTLHITFFFITGTDIQFNYIKSAADSSGKSCRIFTSAHDCAPRYSDVIMSVMASQITSVLVVYWSVCLGVDQRKIKAPRHWPLWGEFTCHRWIPRTKSQ